MKQGCRETDPLTKTETETNFHEYAWVSLINCCLVAASSRRENVLLTRALCLPGALYGPSPKNDLFNTKFPQFLVTLIKKFRLEYSKVHLICICFSYLRINTLLLAERAIVAEKTFATKKRLSGTASARIRKRDLKRLSESGPRHAPGTGCSLCRRTDSDCLLISTSNHIAEGFKRTCLQGCNTASRRPATCQSKWKH